ncbi:hypothetical protein PMAYCL1PPCAC_27133, partial [Pristionchus mayeri]
MMAFAGAIMFQYILTLNIIYKRKLQKMTRTDYCLSRSYQIKENIKVMQMLRKLAFPTILFNLPAFAFISIHTYLPDEERFNVVRNVAVALFDLWIPFYGVSFGLLMYNIEPKFQESVRRWRVAALFLERFGDVTGRFRKITTKSPTPQQPNETDIYFSMLSRDLHADRKHSNMSALSIIEV